MSDVPVNTTRIPLGPSIFGWNKELGLDFIAASEKEVIVEMVATIVKDGFRPYFHARSLPWEEEG